MAIYGLNVCNNIKGTYSTCYTLLQCVYILPLLFTGLLIFYVSQFYACMYIHVCVCVLHVSYAPYSN